MFTTEISALKTSLGAPAFPTSPDTIVRGRQLYAMLSVLIKGRGFLVVKGVADSNGYEALRRLIEMYAPQSKSRSLGILQALTQVPAFKANESLVPQVLDLERVYAEYESTSQQALQESLKTALLLRCIPNNIKNQVHASLPEDASYDAVRDTIFRIERQNFKWGGVAYFNTGSVDTSAPMEIDAVRKGKDKDKKGKGRGDSKGPKGAKNGSNPKGPGKGKGDKGKDGKGKSSKDGKGKGKGSKSQDKSHIECFNCGRRGHYAAECWRSKGQAKVNQVVNPVPSEAAASSATTAGPSASQAGASASQSATTAVRRIEVDLSTLDSGFCSSFGGIRMISQAMSKPKLDQVLVEPYPTEAMSKAKLDEVLVEPYPTEAMSKPKLDKVLVEPYPTEAAIMPGQVLLEPYPSDFMSLVHATLPAMCVPEPPLRSFSRATEPLSFDMSYSDEDDRWTIDHNDCLQGSLSVVSFASDCQVCAIHQGVEIVLDSGADHSCLPASFRTTGEAAPPLQATFRDAQGNVIAPTSVRTAKLDLGPVTINETWLIGPVTTPLLSLGKLYRQGFQVGHVNNQLKLYRDNDPDASVPVYLKHNSLCVQGNIRVIGTSEVSVPSTGEPEPRDADSSSPPQSDFHINALTLKLYGPWLSLKEAFVQVDTGLIANRCYSLAHIDCTLAFPSQPVAFRTTLHNSERGWALYALNEELAKLDDFEVAFPGARLYETITIGSTYRLDIRQLFPEHENQPLVPMPVERAESDDDPEPDDAMDVQVNIEAGGVGGDDEAADDAGAAADDAQAERPIVVNGVELNHECTLSTIRTAAQSLGLGKSGGKATVLQRIKDYLARHDLLWANMPADVHLPREQAPVREPSQDEVRRHSLSHIPFQPWCSACVQHRARSDRHQRHPVANRDHPTICFDFAYTGRPSAPEQKLTCLVASCSFTGANQAWPVPAKGGNLQLRYMTAELTRWIAALGHSEVTLRSDPEPVCLSLQRLIQAQRLRLGLRTHLEQTEPDDHAANSAEPAVETLRQLSNTLLSELEASADVKVGSLDAMHAWSFRHAGFLQQRFTRSQGQTPFELSCGRPYQGKLVCLGETVYGRLKSAVKGQPRWVLGLWLGKLGCSDGHIVFTASGHFLACRSIRRLPQRYLRSGDLMAKLRDHPYSQAAFLAGQMGQRRPQKTPDVPQPAQQPQPQPLGEPSAPASVDPLPYPGYVLPDHAPLSDLVPPPAVRSDFVPEPPTPMQEDSPAYS